MATKTKTEVTPANGAPVRTGTASEIPPKSRRNASEKLTVWKDEIEALRTTDLGIAVEYGNTPDVANLASGLRRYYGVNASSRDINTDDDSPTKGYGVLWVQYPFYEGDDDNLYPDEDKVAENKGKNKK